MKKIIIALVIGVLLMGFTVNGFAHCQIPCGIYDDQMRVKIIAEHITTIETSMNMIQGLSAAKDKDFNQLTRWISNKDAHAQKIQDIVSEYFLAQRIKPIDVKNWPDNEKALKKLTLLHKLIFFAMKAKQTVDLKNVELLKKSLEEFEKLYFEK